MTNFSLSSSALLLIFLAHLNNDVMMLCFHLV